MKQINVYERISMLLSLAKSGFTFEEYCKELAKLAGDTLGSPSAIRKTLQRDIHMAADMHSIKVYFNRRLDRYMVKEDETNPKKMAVLESFDIFRAFQTKQSIDQYVSFESRSSRGTEHLFGLLHAIQNRHPITVSYRRSFAAEATLESVKPVQLKEFKYRWYLLALELDGNLRTFGLDRIDGMTIKEGRFKLGQVLDFQDIYADVYGITNEAGKPVEEIELYFAYPKANYIKTVPLHSSQWEEEIKLDEEGTPGLRVLLKTKINYDLVLELMSHGDEVRVIRPDHLRENILLRARNMCTGLLRKAD